MTGRMNESMTFDRKRDALTYGPANTQAGYRGVEDAKGEESRVVSSVQIRLAQTRRVCVAWPLADGTSTSVASHQHFLCEIDEALSCVTAKSSSNSQQVSSRTAATFAPWPIALHSPPASLLTLLASVHVLCRS